MINFPLKDTVILFIAVVLLKWIISRLEDAKKDKSDWEVLYWYWMKFGCLPEFDCEDHLIIKDKSKLTPNQI